MANFKGISGKKTIASNEVLYKRIHGHDPFFTLTPAGAKALSEFLKENKVEFGLVGPECENDAGIDTSHFRDFLKSQMGLDFSKKEMDGAKAYSLLGAAARGANCYGCDKVALDEDALQAISENVNKRSR